MIDPTDDLEFVSVVHHAIEFDTPTILKALIVLENWLAPEASAWCVVEAVHLTLAADGRAAVRAVVLLGSDVTAGKALFRSIAALRRAVGRSWVSAGLAVEPDALMFSVRRLA